VEPIPFVNSASDLEVLRRLYADATLIRVSNDAPRSFFRSLPKGKRLWVDPAFDGFHHPKSQRQDDWQTYISHFPHSDLLDKPGFLARPKKDRLQEFVTALLEDAATKSPAWLTIPQLPLMDDASRNRINRELATATSLWREESSFEGQLVFPVIITNQRQANKKVERNKRISAIKSCLKRIKIDVVWLVDSSLQDQAGTQNFQRTRFPGIIDFHEEISKILPSGVQTVGGPYWGLNLVLWARNQIDFPAIGLGSGYQYHVAGGPRRQAKGRVALAPLRRWAVHSQDLEGWLAMTVSDLPKDDAARKDFAKLLEEFQSFRYPRRARLQIATFYRTWHEGIASVPAAGRALKLYQNLSSAYVLGKSLEKLPRTEGSARRPEIVAQQFMLNCL